MAKKVILKDQNDIEVLPITRGELVLDASGNPALHSTQFLATQSQPGLMSSEDKYKLDHLEESGPGANNKVAQINTTTNDVYRLLFSETADDTDRTEKSRKSANLTFNPSTGVLNLTGTINANGGTIQSTTWNPLVINTTYNALGFYLQINNISKAGLVYNIENGASLYNATKAAYIGIKDDGTPHYNKNTLLHSGNFNLYSPKLDGTGATGTWGIDISGNAKSSTQSQYLLTGVGSECDANTLAFSDHLLRWYSSIPSTSSNLPTVTGWQNGLLALPLHSNGVTAQLYFSATKALFYRSMASDDWHQIAYKTDIPTETSQLTNDSGYVTGGPYLPLSGGRMNSTAYIRWNDGHEGNDFSDWNSVAGETGLKIISSVVSTSNAPSVYSTALHVKGRYGFQLASIGGSESKFYIRNIRDISDWRQLIHSGNINSFAWTSSNDGTGSGLDADLLDGLEGSWYQNHVHSFDIVNISALYNAGASTNVNTLRYGMLYNYGSASYWVNAPVGMLYGQILNLKNSNTYDLAGQLAWDINHNSTTDTTRYLWWRATDDGTWTEAKWHRIAYAEEIPTVTNYYWANVLISNTSNPATSPTFALTTAKAYFATQNGQILQWGPSKEYWLGSNTTSDFYLWGSSSTAHLRIGTNNTERVRVTKDGNVGIGTTSPENRLDVNGIQQIYQRGNDNTAFKNLLLLKQQNSVEDSNQSWTGSNPSFGIGFRRYWSSGSSPYGETTHAGIYATVSSAWKGGLVFRTKNNQTERGTHDTTALRLRPDGHAIFGNSVETNGSVYINQPSTNRRAGIIGTYDANRAAAIWSMGSSYQIAADGTTLGNLYGAAYVYYGSGYTYGAGKSGGHSFVWAQNGSPTVALGNNIWTSGAVVTGSYVSFGYTGASFTSDIRSTWRTSIYGDDTNSSRLRTVRTDVTIADFSEIYGSGLTWATADTQGYLSVSYSSGKAWIGGGNSNKLNWSTYLVTGKNIGSQSVNYASSAAVASTVIVNNSDANSTYRMVWHSGNNLYSTAGIYCNPSTDAMYATKYYANASAGPHFIGTSTAGNWAYLRLNNSSVFWDIATNSSSTSVGANALDIREKGVSCAGIAIRYNTSSYGRLVVMNNTNTETSIGYLNTKFSSSVPIWTVGAGIGGSTTAFGWWYYNVGYKMYLDTSGNLYAYHFYEISDAKYKINIQDIIGNDNVPKLREFNWKENGSKGYGFIAQELEEQGYSELVNTNEQGEKTVNYSAALSLTVAKLQNKISELEKEIEILKNKN